MEETITVDKIQFSPGAGMTPTPAPTPAPGPTHYLTTIIISLKRGLTTKSGQTSIWIFILASHIHFDKAGSRKQFRKTSIKSNTFH